MTYKLSIDVRAGNVESVTSKWLDKHKTDLENLGESLIRALGGRRNQDLHRGDAGLNEGLVGEYRGEVGLKDGDWGL